MLQFRGLFLDFSSQTSVLVVFQITDDLENENASLRDKVMQLEKSNQVGSF